MTWHNRKSKLIVLKYSAYKSIYKKNFYFIYIIDIRKILIGNSSFKF